VNSSVEMEYKLNIYDRDADIWLEEGIEMITMIGRSGSEN